MTGLAFTDAAIENDASCHEKDKTLSAAATASTPCQTAQTHFRKSPIHPPKSPATPHLHQAFSVDVYQDKQVGALFAHYILDGANIPMETNGMLQYTGVVGPHLIFLKQLEDDDVGVKYIVGTVAALQSKLGGGVE